MLLVEAVHILLARQADLASGVVFPSVSPGPAAAIAAATTGEAVAESKSGTRETSRWSVDIAEMTFDSEPPHPLEEIFSRLEHEEELRSKRSTWSSASSGSLSGVPFGWEREPGKPKQQQQPNHDHPVVNPPPLLSSYARVGSTGRSLYASSSFSKLDFRRRTFSGSLRRLVRGRLLSSASLKVRLSPSASLKKSPSCSSSKVSDHEQIPKQQQQPQPEMDLDLCSPKAVFDGPGGSSSESATSNVTPTHNSMPEAESMPFPASFSPTEAPLDDSLDAVSLSHAVPDSPKAVDEISSPPSTYRPADDNSDVSPEYWSDGLTWKAPPLRSKSSGISAAPDRPIVNKETLFHSKSLSQFQKTSTKSFLSSTSSSEFSIALSGRLSSGMNMNSSRYLDLDFREAWKEAAAGDTSNYKQPTQGNVVSASSQREKQAYDVKADIKNRVKEVVRKTDERAFTFSPVASSFLFAKSQSHDKNMQIFSGNLDSDYIDMKLSDRTGPQEEKTSKRQAKRGRRRRLPFCCCMKG